MLCFSHDKNKSGRAVPEAWNRQEFIHTGFQKQINLTIVIGSSEHITDF